MLERLKRKKTFKLSDYLSPECIVFLNSTDRHSAVDELVDRLYRNEKIHEKALFTQAVEQREGQGSTALGTGIAVPHAKSNAFEQFFVAVGILKGDTLWWDEKHPDPIHYVFLIGGPDNDPKTYLAILSHLTARVKNQEQRQVLLECDTPEQILRRLLD